MVTGWSYFAGSSGVPASWNSCTRTFPREVTRIETCSGLMSTFADTGRSVFTGPSQSPARLFMVSKDVCASDFDAGVLGASILWAADWAKVGVETSSRTADSVRQRDVVSV